MRFIAYYGKGAILTDDYSDDEIFSNKHILNLKDDMRLNGLTYCRLYDENLRYIRKLTV